jgi:DNA modification methylase
MKTLGDLIAGGWNSAINEVVCCNSLDGMKLIPDNSIDCCITSPPYWALRDYGVKGQIGAEESFAEYLENLWKIFDEVKRILKKDGTCFVNLGDVYGGTSDKGNYRAPKNPKGRNGQSKALNKKYQSKSLLQIPSRFSIGMTDRGWILRNTIIWHKPNAMPQSCLDRFSVDFEYIFSFVKSKKYYFEQSLEPSRNRNDLEYRHALRRKNAINYKMKKPYLGNFPKSFRLDGMRNKRCVWSIPTKGFREAHFAVYPPDLIKTPILSGCKKGGIVFDPFMGSWTTARMAKDLCRDFIGFELNPEYCDIGEKRLRQQILL